MDKKQWILLSSGAGLGLLVGILLTLLLTSGRTNPNLGVINILPPTRDAYQGKALAYIDDYVLTEEYYKAAYEVGRLQLSPQQVELIKDSGRWSAVVLDGAITQLATLIQSVKEGQLEDPEALVHLQAMLGAVNVRNYVLRNSPPLSELRPDKEQLDQLFRQFGRSYLQNGFTAEQAREQIVRRYQISQQEAESRRLSEGLKERYRIERVTNDLDRIVKEAEADWQARYENIQSKVLLNDTNTSSAQAAESDVTASDTSEEVAPSPKSVSRNDSTAEQSPSPAGPPTGAVVPTGNP